MPRPKTEIFEKVRFIDKEIGDVQLFEGDAAVFPFLIEERCEFCFKSLFGLFEFLDRR